MENFKSSLATFGRSGLGPALAISLGLHAVLLLQTLHADSILRSVRPATPAGSSLDATLRGSMVPHVGVTKFPARPAATAQTMPPRPETTVSKPAMHSSPAVADAIAAPADQGGVSGRLPVVAAVTEMPSPAASTTADRLSSEAGLNAGGLRQYRLDLAAESRRFKRYPPQALAQGWHGTAEVRVAVAVSGVPQFAQLTTSSGQGILDAAALDMINQAALHTVVPSSLRGREFSVLLPISFAIDSD
ncbi:MAG: TonB family protein [Sterolibacterium sp.]|jgi:protein TonB